MKLDSTAGINIIIQSVSRRDCPFGLNLFCARTKYNITHKYNKGNIKYKTADQCNE